MSMRSNYISIIPSFPVGTVLDWAGNAAPTGWLLCDGSTVSTTTYPALYALISSTYNTGGEAGGTFRLPDLRGRVHAAADDVGGTAANISTGCTHATTSGLEVVVLDATTTPAHGAGTQTSSTDTNTHSHTIPFNRGGGGDGLMSLHGGNPTFFGNLTTGGTNPAVNHNHAGSSCSTIGSSTGHNNMQPTIFMHSIIKAL